MRLLTLIIALFSSIASLLAQGIINFSNLSASSPEQKVYIDEWLNPSALAPGGRQFLVALYFAPFGADEASLIQAGAAAGFFGFGLFSGGPRTVATTKPGDVGIFQVRGWEAVYGSTYEQAAANLGARLGQSPVLIAGTARPHTKELPLNLIDSSLPDRPFRGFVIAVPEPSTGVLLFVGLSVANLL